jgi:ABC-type lipoprotein release transport system permease subunit
MWLFIMAWKNIWRNRSRTLITMAAIYFAVILSILANSLQDGVFNNLIKNVVSFYSGYVQVHKKGYWDEQILDNSFKALKETESRILKNDTINSVTGRLESFALVSSEEITKGVLIVGIEPEKEDKITSLKKKVIEGQYIKSDDHSVLISEGLAARLKVNVKDTIILLGQGYHGATAAGKYAIKGILKFGSPTLNNKTLFMPLALSQDLFQASGNITSYILSLSNTKNLNATAESVRKNIGSGYEVKTWEEIMPDIKQHIKSDATSMKYILGILYMLICFGIFGTILMMMEERKFELGMLVAIGMKKYLLVILLMIESVFTVFSGCIMGVLFSIPLIYYLKIHPIKFEGDTAAAYEQFGFEAIFPVSTDYTIFLNQSLIVLLIGLILSVYPIYKIIRLDPIISMKR